VVSAIHILNASDIGNDHLELIARRVQETFATTTDISDRPFNLSRAYDSSRGQYNSTVLLAELLNSSPPAENKLIAVVDVDLYIPVLTFVFGEAQLNGRAAVVSVQRLSNEFYGLPQDEKTTFRRLEKEIVHELGHTFGLFHCRRYDCVMRSSTYVEEIDLKGVEPCESCRTSLKGVRWNPS